MPVNLAWIVMRCLEKTPGDRYQSASELLEALEGARAHEDVALEHTVTTPRGDER